MSRSRIVPALLSTALVLGAGALTVAPQQAADAIGAPVMIDDFGSNVVGTRTVTPLPEPGASTTAPGTFSESGGLATMTMNGDGNGQGGVRLGYALNHVDLTSGGNNTQFFLEFGSIERLPVQTLGETAASISILVTDSNGVTGVYNTGISNVIGFNVVLNFSCVAGPPCFSPQPDFTNVTAVTVEIRYPRNFDSVGSLTTVLDTIRTTPTGGVVPSAPNPVVSTGSTTVFGQLGDSVTFDVDFTSDTGPAAVTHAPPSNIGLRAQDVATRGTAVGHDNVSVSGGPASYQVTVGPLTSVGTVGIDIPEKVVTDAWGQDNLASSGATTVTFEIATPPTLATTDPPPFQVGQASSFAFTTTAGEPAPTYSIVGTPLPAGLTLDSDGTLSGTPAAGTSGSHSITVRATNVAGADTHDYTLIVRESPTVTGPDTVSFDVGTAGGFAVSYLGFPAPGVTVQNAPAWLNVVDDGAGTVTFSGTPPGTAVGTRQITVVAQNVVGQDQHTTTIEVNPVDTTIVATPAANPSTYGQEVVVTATVSSPQPVAGSVQFRIDGTVFGAPVALVDGVGVSPPLTAAGGGSLGAGVHSVTADFTPSGPGANPSSTSFDQVVDKADTTATVHVQPGEVVADVAATAPGAGTPTGSVTFALNGSDIGQATLVAGRATLAYVIPNGQAAQVSATYDGDDNFTGSSASTTREDPTIVVALRSPRPPTRFGWWGSPVTVQFECTVGSAPLVNPCPGPVTLNHNAVDKIVQRTIHATDGGVATVVTQLNIDLDAPHVRVAGIRDGAVYTGHAPRGECVGTDRLSGIASCRISRHQVGTVVHYRAVARDEAANTASVRGHYRVLQFFIQGARFRDHAFAVRAGHKYTLVALAQDQPRYFLAAPAPTTPVDRGPLMTPAGTGRWVLRLTITPQMRARELWNTGVKTGGELHIVRLRVKQ